MVTGPVASSPAVWPPVDAHEAGRIAEWRAVPGERAVEGLAGGHETGLGEGGGRHDFVDRAGRVLFLHGAVAHGAARVADQLADTRAGGEEAAAEGVGVEDVGLEAGVAGEGEDGAVCGVQHHGPPPPEEMPRAPQLPPA